MQFFNVILISLGIFVLGTVSNPVQRNSFPRDHNSNTHCRNHEYLERDCHRRESERHCPHYHCPSHHPHHSSSVISSTGFVTSISTLKLTSAASTKSASVSSINTPRITSTSISTLLASSTSLITSTTSSQPLSSSSIPSPTATSIGKRGLPYNSVDLIQHFDDPGSKVTWAYNWASKMEAGFPSNLEYVPMLWSNGTDKTSTWFQNADNAIARGSKHLLAFNEPDNKGQANMSPQAAADAYLAYMQPYAGKVKLGGPAVTENGTEWLVDFLALCTACTIDFIPIHIYNNGSQYYRDYITKIHNLADNRPIWLTEFSPTSATSNQTAFMEKILPVLDGISFLERYAWFLCSPTRVGSLCQQNDNPSQLGKLYELF